jgi:hypothetical protein
MTPVRFFAVCGVVLALGCSKDKTFTEPSPPLAAVTWANAVPDTGQVDMRIVDILSNAGFFNVNFRDALTFPEGIEAGRREIRVFMSSTNPAISQTVLVDTTVTFVDGGRYGFYVGGFARAGQARAVVLPVNLPSPGATQIAIRVLNLAPSFAGSIRTLADTTAPPDAFLIKGTAVPSGSPQLASVAFGGASSYAVVDTGRYRLILTSTGTTDPAILEAVLPLGSVATSSQGAIAGSLIPGSVLTAIVVPRAVPGSAAPQTRQGGLAAKATDTTVAEASRRITRSTDTVTIQSGSFTIVTRRPDPKDATKLTTDTTIGKTGTAASAGVTTGDLVVVSGATQPEYNGWQSVLAAADTLVCKPSRPGDTAALCAATADTSTRNDTVTTRFRFRYRIVGTPVSPGTGTVVYRLYPPAYAATDFVTPQIVFVVDKRP